MSIHITLGNTSKIVTQPTWPDIFIRIKLEIDFRLTL